MAVNGSSHNSVPIQVNCEATAAATMKARKEDDKKIKDARIAASTKMAEDVFGAECLKCKVLTEELPAIKCELKKTERQLEDKKRDVKDEKLADTTSVL